MYKVYVRSSNEHIGTLVGSTNYQDDAMAIARVWQGKPHVAEVRVEGPVYVWTKLSSDQIVNDVVAIVNKYENGNNG